MHPSFFSANFCCYHVCISTHVKWHTWDRKTLLWSTGQANLVLKGKTRMKTAQAAIISQLQLKYVDAICKLCQHLWLTHHLCCHCYYHKLITAIIADPKLTSLIQNHSLLTWTATQHNCAGTKILATLFSVLKTMLQNCLEDKLQVFKRPQTLPGLQCFATCSSPSVSKMYLNFGWSLLTTATSISVGLKSADSIVDRQVIAV